MPSLALGIDIGSSGCKISVIDDKGRLIVKGSENYETSYPFPGWAEQDPMDWEKACKKILNDFFASGKISSNDIACIALSGATHTLVCLDAHGDVLRPAILWTDKRTIQEVEWLKKEYLSLIIEETLHAPNVNWTLPYLIWIRKREPAIWSKIHTVLMPKDYLRYRLTGIQATDFMDAHGTLLFNVLLRKWSESICEKLEIPSKILPTVLPATEIAGKVTAEAACRFGLCKDIPVLVGTTDQACEAFGTGAIRSGDGVIKLATAGNVAVVTDRPFPDPPNVYAYYHLKSGLWYTLSGTSSAAGCYKWIRDMLFPPGGFIKNQEVQPSYSELDSLAANAPPGSDGLIFHPYFQGSLSDPYLRADLLGLTLAHRREHLLRATLEGVAFSLYECLLKEKKMGVEPAQFRIIGGGARSALWRKIVCDIFGKPMIRVEEDDASYGTAMLAGLGIGFFTDIDNAVAICVRQIDEIYPDPEDHAAYQKFFMRFVETLMALKSSYRSLQETAS